MEGQSVRSNAGHFRKSETTYDKDLLGYRLLEDDVITVYGTACSTYSYKAVSGATITIPWLHADIIEM